jgi:hypothetical protein
MSLDERMRDGLRRSAETGALDADDVFDAVVSSHRRSRLRGRVVRHATAVAVVLTLFLGVAIFASWRATPLRYRSVATVGVGAAASVQTGRIAVKLSDPLTLALAPGTRRATLLAAHLSPNNTEVEFRATRTGVNELSLAATAASRDEAATVTDKWASTLALFRRHQAKEQLAAARRNITRRVTTLHQQLQVIDAQLAKLDPKVYGSVWKYDGPGGALWTGHIQPNPPPPVPERGTPHELNLAFERIQLISALEKYGKNATSGGFISLTPDVITKRISQKPPSRVDGTPSAAVPAFSIWIVGLVLILLTGFAVYRRRAKATLRT